MKHFRRASRCSVCRMTIMPYDMDLVVERLRADWNTRACENARHYIASDKEPWCDSEYFDSGGPL